MKHLIILFSYGPCHCNIVSFSDEFEKCALVYDRGCSPAIQGNPLDPINIDVVAMGINYPVPLAVK